MFSLCLFRNKRHNLMFMNLAFSNYVNNTTGHFNFDLRTNKSELKLAQLTIYRHNVTFLT